MTTPFRSSVTHSTYVALVSGIIPPTTPTLCPNPMSTAPTKLQRWLDVIAHLAARHYPVSREDLWRNVPAYAPGVHGESKDQQSVRRMFERDKDELRELGIPIETVDYTINHSEQTSGYRLSRKDFHLPYLRLLREAGPAADGEESPGAHRPPRPDDFTLTEPEAGAALSGLRELSALPAFPLSEAARSAFRKLAFDLDPRVEESADVIYAIDPETESTSGALSVLNRALRARKAVTFHYRSISSNSEEERTVFPFGLLFQHGRWYLVAYDPGRDGMRMFRTGRMGKVKANTKSPGTPDYDVPSDFSLADYAGRKAWELGGEEEEAIEATVHFRFPRSLWADRNEHGTLLEEAEDGSQRRSFTVHRRDPFLRWVLSLAGDARVVEPPLLRAEFRALVDRAIALHEGTGSSEDGGTPHG